MTFDPMRRGRSNRDRRDQAFARSVIAAAERHRRAAGIITREADISSDTTDVGLMHYFSRQTVARMQTSRPVAACARLTFSFAARVLDAPRDCPDCDGYDIPGHREAMHRQCCDGNDPACPTHGIAASNARQNEFYRQHEDEPWVDALEPDRCLLCGTPLSGNCEVRDDHYPFCSTQCAVEAESDDD